MCKKRISWCFVVFVSVFCFTEQWKVVGANEGASDDTDLPVIPTDLPTVEAHQPEEPVPELSQEPTELNSHNPPLLETQPETIEVTESTVPPPDPPQTLSFTHSSQVYHDAEPSSGESPQTDSLLLSSVPIKVQKCCPPQQVLQLGQFTSECVDRDANFVVDVFVANKTHYWNHTKSTARDVLLVTRNPCTQSRFLLNPDEDVNDTFHLLHNSSLYVPFSMDMYGEDDYCVDTILTATSLFTSAVICTSTPKTDFLHYLFGAGLVISVICLIALAVYSTWRTDIDDDHKKCLAFFSGTMAASFFFIAISFFFGTMLPRIVNILLAYTVYYLKLNYFIWLTVLCYDTYRCVKLATDNCIDRESFIKRYMLAAYLTPVIFICINLFDKCNPALPNLYLEFSYSSSFLWAICLFYVPTVLTQCINIYIMCSIVLPQGRCKDINEFLRYMRSEKWRPTPAPENIAQLKNMYRRTGFLCCLILFFLVLDFIIFLLPSGGEQRVHFMFRDVVYCLQGLFVGCVFVRKDCCRKTTPNELNMTELALLETSNQNGTTILAS